MVVLNFIFGVVCASLLCSLVYSHSWLHCSDYDGTITGQDFDEGKCNGYIRQWSSVWGATGFATDRGTNFFGSEGNWCQSSFSSDIESMYDSGYPAATWNIGETVTLVWPAKNHANYECFGNIPDTSMKLYYNPIVNPDTQPSGAVDSDDWDLLIDWHTDLGCTAGTDGCGFQNCPLFCDDTDGAPCFQEYTVSRSDFPDDGYYTIMWYWIFNPGDPYTTCFEVNIVDDGSGGNTGDDDDDDDANTGDDDDDDDGDDDDDDDSGSVYSSSSDYIVTVPICYSGGDGYSENTLITGANNAYDANVVEVDWSVLGSVYENGDEWNVTISTHTSNAPEVNSAAYSYATTDSELCESIEDEFNDGGSCEVCDPGAMRTYTLNGSSSSSSDDDEYGVKLTIGLVVAGLVILSLLLFYVYKEKINPSPKTTQNQNGMATHVPQHSHIQAVPAGATDTATR